MISVSETVNVCIVIVLLEALTYYTHDTKYVGTDGHDQTLEKDIIHIRFNEA